MIMIPGRIFMVPLYTQTSKLLAHDMYKLMKRQWNDDSQMAVSSGKPCVKNPMNR
jgi:hypothetical protein